MVALLAKPVRGVARRRAEALRVEELPHETILKPLANSLIVTATEQDFISAVLADLKQADWRDRLDKRAVQRELGIPTLCQPVHRTYNLILLEAACLVPGGPRLDPKKIKGTGMVLRRVVNNGNNQGWMSEGAAKRGWLQIFSATDDPDPALRKKPATGLSALDSLLAQRRTTIDLSEQAFPLFIAPPDVCEALKKTVLYGIVPVTSSDQSEAAVVAPDYVEEAKTDNGALDSHLSGFFKPSGIWSFPNAGKVLQKEWLNDPAVQEFVTFLRQLSIECGAFDNPSKAAQLLAELSKIQLQMIGSLQTHMPAKDFLAQAARIILEGEDNLQGLRMPAYWPAVGGTLKQAAYEAMSARFAETITREGKFDDQGRQYVLRAFIRIACKRDCPPKLLWSDPSENFLIQPWWAGATPPVKIPLPDITDRALLRKLKPGVAFQVPKGLANILNKDLSKVLSGGNPGSGPAFDIDWICSFSIPIITICAFVLLSIVLSLLNIIFFWLPFVKICLPIPKRGGS